MLKISNKYVEYEKKKKLKNCPKSFKPKTDWSNSIHTYLNLNWIRLNDTLVIILDWMKFLKTDL